MGASEVQPFPDFGILDPTDQNKGNSQHQHQHEQTAMFVSGLIASTRWIFSEVEHSQGFRSRLKRVPALLGG
jgi:hypothetical protein